MQRVARRHLFRYQKSGMCRHGFTPAEWHKVVTRLRLRVDLSGGFRPSADQTIRYSRSSLSVSCSNPEPIKTAASDFFGREPFYIAVGMADLQF